MYILCSFSLITRTSARHDFIFLSFCIFEIDFFVVTNNNFLEIIYFIYFTYYCCKKQETLYGFEVIYLFIYIILLVH